MENSDRKTSSSLKVGILTVVALTILIFTVLWIKGRTLSAGERIEVEAPLPADMGKLSEKWPAEL